ncbi:MAG: GHKL domain-containing protein [Lachnospiraceae bacterium]|nr:GHKL domain-containing protein [Lachnospiraceae bacterium]
MTLTIDSSNLIAIGSFVINFLQCFFINYIFFKKKCKFNWFSVFGSVVYIILVLCTDIATNTFVPRSVIEFAVTLVLFGFIVDSNFKEKILLPLEVYFTNVCLNYVIETMICMMYHIEISSINDGMELAGCSILLVIFLVVALIKKYKIIKLERKVKNRITQIFIYFSMCIMGISIPLTIGGLGYASAYVTNTKFNDFANVLSLFAFSSMIFLVLFVLYINDTNKKIKNSFETEKMLMEIQKNYYEEMLKKEEGTRRFRHDFINYLICLKGMAEKDDKQMVMDYIGQLEHRVQELKPTYYTVGNDVMDILINGLIPQIKDAKVVVKGTCKEEIEMDSIELCTIVSNLIQNAVEELNSFNQNQDSKYFKLNISQGKTNMKLEISNTSREKVGDKSSGLPQTSKQNKKDHGIGLKNVKETVEKNHGTFSWKYEEEEFKVEVILPLRRK